MIYRNRYANSCFRILCVLLAVVAATAPSISVVAQTNAAQQAVRRSVDNLGRQPDDREAIPPESADRGRYYDERTMVAEPTAGMIDTSYVSPGAIALIVLRPAQIMSSPSAELLPKEVVSAAGLQYFGIDPAAVEEIALFVRLPPTHSGLRIKFTSPFRATSIPPHLRPQAQLADLGGKRYLKSLHPVMPSFYGPNNRTLVVAGDGTLRQLVESKDQPKTGPLVDRARSAPAGSDLYVAIDFASLRPFVDIGIGQAKATGKVPPEAEKFLEVPKLLSAAEVTLNISSPGPTSLVVHANDEAAAQQLETLIGDTSNQYQSSSTYDDRGMADPVSQAMAQYNERVFLPFRPQRNGASLTVFHIDGQNPAQQQLVSAAAVAICMTAIQAARQAAQQPPAIPEQPGLEQPQPEQLPESTETVEPGLR